MPRSNAWPMSLVNLSWPSLTWLLDRLTPCDPVPMPKRDVFTPDRPRVAETPGPESERRAASERGCVSAPRATAAADWPMNWRRVSGVMGGSWKECGNRCELYHQFTTEARRTRGEYK